MMGGDGGGECFPGYSFLQLLTHLMKTKSAAKLRSLPLVDRTAMYAVIIRQEKWSVLLPTATEAATAKALPTAYDSRSHVLLHSLVTPKTSFLY